MALISNGANRETTKHRQKDPQQDHFINPKGNKQVTFVTLIKTTR